MLDHLPLTLRLIFYRLVGSYGYDKTERAYDNLGEVLNRARRARMIPMESIRDDGGARIVNFDDFRPVVVVSDKTCYG